MNLKYVTILLLTMCRYKDMHFIAESEVGGKG